jgi:hypothetical protein
MKTGKFVSRMIVLLLVFFHSTAGAARPLNTFKCNGAQYYFKKRLLIWVMPTKSLMDFVFCHPPLGHGSAGIFLKSHLMGLFRGPPYKDPSGKKLFH